MVEELVQLLVRIIDAELLEAVEREVLKAEDVEHPEKPRGILTRIRAVVHVIYEPGEGARVERLRHSVAILPGLLHLQRDLRDVAAHVYLPDQHYPSEILHLEAQQRRYRVDNVPVLLRELASLTIDVLEAQVPQPQDG